MKNLFVINGEKLKAEANNNGQDYLKPLLNCLEPVHTEPAESHEDCKNKECTCIQHHRNQWSGSVSLIPTAGPLPCTCFAVCPHKNQMRGGVMDPINHRMISLTLCLDCEEKLPNEVELEEEEDVQEHVAEFHRSGRFPDEASEVSKEVMEWFSRNLSAPSSPSDSGKTQKIHFEIPEGSALGQMLKNHPKAKEQFVELVTLLASKIRSL